MHVPAALEQWAAEHNEQLSAATLSEVGTITATLEASSLGDRQIDDLGSDFGERLATIFPAGRAERAATLIDIVAGWHTKSQADVDRHTSSAEIPADPEAPGTPGAPGTGSPTDAAASEAAAPTLQPDTPPESPPTPPDSTPPDSTPPDSIPQGPPVTPTAPTAVTAVTQPQPGANPPPAPLPTQPVQSSLPDPDIQRIRDKEAEALLQSERIDDLQLYGPRSRWKSVLGWLVVFAAIAGLVALGTYLFNQSDTADDSVTAEPTVPAVTVPPATVEASQQAQDAEPEPTPTELAPTATPEPEPLSASTEFWADVTPILNSGSSQILASTYAVSPANRAVLTGHTAAITGIAISDDGRVLTSGADRRLVDWGADVTLASPDVLNVPAPLTVLERTTDQRLIAGDSAGNVTIINLVETAEPIVLSIHPSAISAAAELADGRIAVASVDGEVAVFDVETPAEQVSLSHSVEVTALAALPDGALATAAVDGIIRIWRDDEPTPAVTIQTLPSPATALTLLSDGRLATASVTGDIHVVPPTADAADQVVVLPGHVGAIRTLHETTAAGPSGPMLASGGDDTTIRLWDITSATELRVLEGHGDIVSGLGSLPDGRLVSTSGDGTGRVWDLSVPPGTPTTPPHDWNLAAMVPWDNDQFVTGGVDGKVVLVSTAETSEPQLLTQHAAPIVGVSVLESGNIVSLDASSVMRVNEPSGSIDAEVEFTLSPGATAIDALQNLGVITGHADGTVRFHDFAQEVASVAAHEGGVNDVTTLSSGLVASAGQDNLVRITDFETNTIVGTFDLHTAPVDIVVELADGRIATAGSDGIYLFTVDGLADGHERLNGSRARTISLLALPGDRLISTGDDGRVRLWDLTAPEAEPVTLIDIPGIINPHLVQAGNGLFAAGAARGYVVFTLS